MMVLAKMRAKILSMMGFPIHMKDIKPLAR